MSISDQPEAAKKSRRPRFPDGKFFHDVPLFDLDFLEPRERPESETPKMNKSN